MTLFDKIHLAQLAVDRASLNFLSNKRFQGEFETARLWTQHRILHAHNSEGKMYSWVST